MIRIIVPGQPVAKARPRMAVVNGHARAYTPAKTVAYEGLVAKAGHDVMGDATLLDGPLAVTVLAYFERPQSWTRKKAEATIYHTVKPDGDNILKAASDALNGIVWHDDKQIASAQVMKLYADKPQLVIEVRPL